VEVDLSEGTMDLTEGGGLNLFVSLLSISPDIILLVSLNEQVTELIRDKTLPFNQLVLPVFIMVRVSMEESSVDEGLWCHELVDTVDKVCLPWLLRIFKINNESFVADTDLHQVVVVLKSSLLISIFYALPELVWNLVEHAVVEITLVEHNSHIQLVLLCLCHILK